MKRQAPDIVPDVDEPTLREMYGPDADEIIAFKRFLALPRVDGVIQCPSPDYMAYGRGEISGAELVRRTDAA